jgi:hypothetical protein
MMEAVRTSETSVDNYFTRQYIPEDNSEIQSLLLLTFRTQDLPHFVESLYVTYKHT